MAVAAPPGASPETEYRSTEPLLDNEELREKYQIRIGTVFEVVDKDAKPRRSERHAWDAAYRQPETADRPERYAHFVRLINVRGTGPGQILVFEDRDVKRNAEGEEEQDEEGKRIYIRPADPFDEAPVHHTTAMDSAELLACLKDGILEKAPDRTPEVEEDEEHEKASPKESVELFLGITEGSIVAVNNLSLSDYRPGVVNGVPYSGHMRAEILLSQVSLVAVDEQGKPITHPPRLICFTFEEFNQAAEDGKIFIDTIGLRFDAKVSVYDEEEGNNTEFEGAMEYAQRSKDGLAYELWPDTGEGDELPWNLNLTHSELVDHLWRGELKAIGFAPEPEPKKPVDPHEALADAIANNERQLEVGTMLQANFESYVGMCKVWSLRSNTYRLMPVDGDGKLVNTYQGHRIDLFALTSKQLADAVRNGRLTLVEQTAPQAPPEADDSASGQEPATEKATEVGLVPIGQIRSEPGQFEAETVRDDGRAVEEYDRARYREQAEELINIFLQAHPGYDYSPREIFGLVRADLERQRRVADIDSLASGGSLQAREIDHQYFRRLIRALRDWRVDKEREIAGETGAKPIELPPAVQNVEPWAQRRLDEMLAKARAANKGADDQVIFDAVRQEIDQFAAGFQGEWAERNRRPLLRALEVEQDKLS